jgi:hypothetical protein
VPEERAGFRKFGKYALVVKKGVLVGVHGHDIGLIRVPVEDHELVVPVIFGDTVDQPQVAAALPALFAIKDHAFFTRVLFGVSSLPS